jgi:hypothetical protein
MAELGSDFASVEDVDANLTPVSGRVAYAQAIARRLIAPAGSLFYDTDYGFGLSGFLSAPIVGTTGKIEAGIERECFKDERTKDVDAEVTFDEAAKALTARVDLTDAEGPFALTLSVSELSTQVLLENI